jgi:hypothetical protein
MSGPHCHARLPTLLGRGNGVPIRAEQGGLSAAPGAMEGVDATDGYGA